VVPAPQPARISLVLLDRTMPRLSGREALVRLLEIDPNVVVVFASGFSAEQVTEEEKRRLYGFVGKPYRPNDLVGAVRAALDEARARAAARPRSALTEGGAACSIRALQ
jgi:DNA-binding NtrC family response regulator